MVGLPKTSRNKNVKYKSPEHTAECAKRSFLEFDRLEPGKMYTIDANKGDIITAIPDSEVFKTKDAVDWDCVSTKEPLRWEPIRLCSKIMFVGKYQRWSFNAGEGWHYQFLLGEKTFWFYVTDEGLYGFFLVDAEWVRKTSSKEFQEGLNAAIAASRPKRR